MNDYITLDGKTYPCSAQKWTPRKQRPMQARLLLSGRSNVTFGPRAARLWEGIILCPVSGTGNEGTVTDLRTTLEKMASLAFVDHYGTSSTVVVMQQTDEKSISPKWDAADNAINFQVTLLEIQ